MKLSLSWIFDHIAGATGVKDSWYSLDVNELIQKCSSVTAEIEHVQPWTCDLSLFAVARVKAQKNDTVILDVPEWRKEYTLSMRSDLLADSFFLVVKEEKGVRWATLADAGAEREGFFPAVWCSDECLKGEWRKGIEVKDYILTLDNKAVTHRPDLWGHRGFAREFAALSGLTLLPEDLFINSLPVRHYETVASLSSQSPYSISIHDVACRRFAGLYIPFVEARASSIAMAFRLARIDEKPINFLVDATNYVMFDSGQPMHAFDAQLLPGSDIVVRSAQAGEHLRLLDNETINLRERDLIVAVAGVPVALAGVMGGAATAVSAKTTSLFIEAANFTAGSIRLTALHHKRRTHASARFEKSLDPNQNTVALGRYLKLLDVAGVSYTASSAILSVGALIPEPVLTITHERIEASIGMAISIERVVSILEKLGFGVQVNHEEQYCITVPTYRASKDIALEEDIIEEVARFIGYGVIPHQLPSRLMQPRSLQVLNRRRELRFHSAFSMNMHEVCNYPLYDEDFLKELAVEPHDTLSLLNPLSSQARRLVTSLIPHLIKNIIVNKHKQETLSFFELARTWRMRATTCNERELYSGVFYKHTDPVDFYALKEKLQRSFEALQIPVTWTKPQRQVASWFHPYQVAELQCEGKTIGYAGMLSSNIEKILEGKVFGFEIEAQALIGFEPATHHFEPLGKYQPVTLDISMLIQKSMHVAEVEELVRAVDQRIKHVFLCDYFEKPEWPDKRSVTVRFVVQDDTKTLNKQDIDALLQAVTTAVVACNISVR